MKQLNNKKIKLGYEKMVKEYTQFRDDILKLSASEIYDFSFEITAIKSFYECCVGSQTDETVRRLLIAFADNKMSLELLYDEYLSQENVSITTWDDIIEFFYELLNLEDNNK